MSKNILEILNLKFMEVTKQFKSMLEKRTQVSFYEKYMTKSLS